MRVNKLLILSIALLFLASQCKDELLDEKDLSTKITGVWELEKTEFKANNGITYGFSANDLKSFATTSIYKDNTFYRKEVKDSSGILKTSIVKGKWTLQDSTLIVFPEGRLSMSLTVKLLSDNLLRWGMMDSIHIKDMKYYGIVWDYHRKVAEVDR